MHDIAIYMLQVREHYRYGVQPPLGYDPNEKDLGYRSALRFYGLQRTNDLDDLATQIIYGRGEFAIKPSDC